MEQKRYHSIVRYGHRSTTNVLNKGDQIIIQEKIDGANASFAVVDGELKCWSRNKELDAGNTLSGFYGWVKQTINPDKLLDGVIYFGEWTTPHKVQYEGYKNQFFLYDLYNTHLEEYVSFSMVKDEAKRLDLNLVPVFYEGEHQSFEHLMSFVGKTELNGVLGGEQMGEGIVVKNVNYRDNFGKQMFVKLVVDKFAEVQRQKQPKDPKKKLSPEELKVRECITTPRVEKQLFAMVDEGLLPSDYGLEEMGTILKHIFPLVAQDILKEEMDEFPYLTVKDIQAFSSRALPYVVREIIKEKQSGGIPNESL